MWSVLGLQSKGSSRLLPSRESSKRLHCQPSMYAISTQLSSQSMLRLSRKGACHDFQSGFAPIQTGNMVLRKTCDLEVVMAV
mmetsp:Transcript_47105/g.92705  ORF Transcript_47105/g.92705 Transcript_47105/m.92705 type:complete len:82 (+) Transcript_47105:396-641(+)